MAKLTNSIEEYIIKLLESSDGIVEIQRSLLAEHFSCAPSQINYVLTTRFTPYKGYFVESRRGGGGYIRIVEVDMTDDFSLYAKEVEDGITVLRSKDILRSLYNQGHISLRERQILDLALSDASLQGAQDKNKVRGDILKNILLLVFNKEV
ncbi:MAG: CtsR family transcriptional regulator [Peptoniphilus sp. oral taxon 375]|uniref:CtsR family transcriptional regulator n=1 Tax=Urinicoccus timonensis TaxID=2024205 RepID=UPI00021A2970|nr:CtsR family transcriptional regulator [Urinicoccus timonensis]EGS31592.1 transcriptional repressor of class III stress protein CtsR [Peptoniphilus sp. oral taxon 375 str. F0436]MBS4872309.1 CtsR family transcriptional regulator [Peptoniphilus sp. oral taxon 375]